jgi:hypothetical protein
MSCSPLHDITRRSLRWPRTGPTPPTNHQAEGRATVQAELSHRVDYLNKVTRQDEYSNTQQGLPGHGILSHITILMKAFQALGKIFSGKAVKVGP